jgi:beta-galactosidase
MSTKRRVRSSRPPRETSAATNGAARPRVSLHPHGLELDGRVLPMFCGAMHYWRHAPSEWSAGLDAMRRIGFRMVDTYVPWAVHERAPGDFDFGERDPRLDVARFLELAHERDLAVILRPGPHINAELTFFGLPERVVWDRACQARSPRQNPVILPMVPVCFPVPSYASDVFHDESARWLRAVAERLAPLKWPDGPIVLLQIDNEGALYFRDGAYDQDYHPDAIRLFREYLKEKYGTVGELRSAWGAQASFATVDPPHRYDAKLADDLPRHLDWMEFHEHLLSYAMQRMKSALVGAGFDGVPTSHNFPLGEAATPLNPARMSGSIDLMGLDYYHRANPTDHTTIMRRTSELASRCEGDHTPPFGAEVGAGFPPFMPPIDELDSMYTLVTALAYGLRGYSAYMAVERDRWVGAPIDAHGRERPFARRFEELHRALERTRFHTLRRRAPVRLVVPRSLRGSRARATRSVR